MPEFNVPAGAPRAAVTLVREFHAPPELMFKLWVEPRHLAAWWGPASFDNPACEVDARVGGAMRIHMRAPNGVVHPMIGEFVEVEPPSRLAFTTKAIGPAGETLLEGWNIVTFEPTAACGTRLTVEARAIGVAANAPQMLAGMNAGWSGSLEKLATLVALQLESAS